MMSGKEGLPERRTAPSSQHPAWGGTVSPPLFSLLLLSLQSPRASCLLFLQACSHCGPQWAPFHRSHLPQAQERLRPLHPPAQVSLLHAKAAGGGKVRSRDLETDFLLCFASCFSAQWNSHHHSCWHQYFCPSVWLCTWARGWSCPWLSFPSSLDRYASASTFW